MKKPSTTVNKRDFKKLKLEKKSPTKKGDIEEFVDANGEPIEGSQPKPTSSEIRTAPQQTGDEFVKTTRQRGLNSYSMLGASGTAYSHGMRTGIGPENNIEEPGNIEEVAKQKMKNMIEDFLSKSQNQDSMLKRKGETDEISPIPSIEKLKNTKPDAVRITNELVKVITNNALTGSEIVTILGDILDKVGDKIPTQYKMNLKGKL